MLSWRNNHYSPRCEFLIRTAVFCAPPPERSYCGSWLGWVPRWKESLFTKKIVLVTTTRKQKETSNTRFLYNKTFLTLLSLSRHKTLHEIYLFGRKWQRGKRRNESDLFRRYKEDNYGSLLQTHWLSGLFSRLCWQTYLDSQRFYFHLLVLIGPARFNKFSQSSVSLSDCSNVCLPSGHCRKMSVSDCRKMSVSLCPLFRTDCLYRVRRSIDNFWSRPWIIIWKSFGPPSIFV